MNTQKTYPDTGIYRVRLTGVSAERCADSTEKDIRVLRQIEFYFPNAFGPERNHANRGFGLSSTQFGLVRSYEIRVYNRWGEMVFVSTDVNKLWTGENAFQGVYIYKALIYDIYNVLHEVKGVLELLE